jgi:hypothetical protein
MPGSTSCICRDRTTAYEATVDMLARLHTYRRYSVLLRARRGLLAATVRQVSLLVDKYHARASCIEAVASRRHEAFGSRAGGIRKLPRRILVEQE